MMQSYQEIYEFVLANNEPLKEVVPLYKINVQYNDRTETILTTNISEANSIVAPFIEIDIENQKQYDEYLLKLNEYTERVEYIWYILFKEEWKDLTNEEFENCYKKCWDNYHKEGGWDLVSKMMQSVVEENDN
jgi:hypothetical protein